MSNIAPALKQPKAVFLKTRRYTRAADLVAAGFEPYFQPVEAQGGVRWMINGRERLVACSNDYLGLSCDERVRQAARDALELFGVSCTGSRFLTGTLSLHERLERELAEFLGVESVLTFSAGFLGCLSVLSSLGGRKDILYFDKENHASLYDGGRLAFSRVRKYRHNDVDHLRYLIEADKNTAGGRIVVTDGVFSMTGHIARLPEIVEIANRYDAAVMVDDAHATGLLGRHGRGTAEHFGLEGEVDLTLGTFSKAFGSLGGFVGADAEVVDYIKHVARPFMFTASLPAMQIAATLKSLELIQKEDWRREKMWDNVEFYVNGLHELGFDTLGSRSPIVPVQVNEEERAFRLWKGLWEAGIYTSPAVPPSVPAGQCIVRTSITAGHSREDLLQILRAFESVGRRQGII
ncbi:MAG: aminotransferase class I/II-fold pyridoxal phosphate-dependent enzyme [Acidobacteriota bacterium]